MVYMFNLLSMIGDCPASAALPVASQLDDWIQPIIENVQNLRHVHTRVSCNYFDQWFLNLLMTGLKTWDRFIMQLNYWKIQNPTEWLVIQVLVILLELQERFMLFFFSVNRWERKSFLFMYPKSSDNEHT